LPEALVIDGAGAGAAALAIGGAGAGTLELAVIHGVGPLAVLVAVIVALLLVDLLFFARGRAPTFREAAAWSLGWFVLSLLVALPVLALDGTESAVNYTTVYLIERSLSLDNLFVFLLIFGYFQVPQAQRGRLIMIGIVGALAVRGVAIVSGIALLERFDWVIYVLGAGLVVFAVRMLRASDDHEVDVERTLAVRVARRVWPAATPAGLALISLVVTDIVFAIDSIPAAFGITTDAFVIWTANAFALMGLRALFVLVEQLVERFRYLNETIAVVLLIVGLKLLLEDVIHVSAPASLAIVALAFAVGITASLAADHRDARGARP
jgi:tellurite resistance protein TerC